MNVSLNTRKRLKQTNRVFGYIGTYIFLILIALIVLIPIIYIIGLSFDGDASLYRDEARLFPRIWSVQAYIDLFVHEDFLLWFGNTAMVGGINAALVVILVTPTAYSFSRLRFKGRKQSMLLFMVLQMFPSSMSMLAYYLILGLVGLSDNLFGMVIIFACSAVPGSAFMVKGFLDTISRNVEEAAMLDGASRFMCIRKIILPLAFPMIGLIAIFGFAAPFGDYLLSLILLRDPNQYMVALGVQSFITGQVKYYSKFAASALLSSLPITIIYLILQKVIFKGLKASYA